MTASLELSFSSEIIPQLAFLNKLLVDNGEQLGWGVKKAAIAAFFICFHHLNSFLPVAQNLPFACKGPQKPATTNLSTTAKA
jgi:hypothetical protein